MPSDVSHSCSYYIYLNPLLLVMDFRIIELMPVSKLDLGLEVLILKFNSVSF